MKHNIFILFVFIPAYCFSQEEKVFEDPEWKNEISLFLGGTSHSEENAFTIGLDYQYRISRIVGVGILIDYATGNLQSLLVGPILYLHASNFEFIVAPAIEFEGDETVYVTRLGVEYGFEFSRYSISPGVFFDTERNNRPALAYGVSFGFKL